MTIQVFIYLSRAPTLQFAIIFLPGFSTKNIATEYSGRGVGMDVVKTNIKNLGGDVSVDSELGKGTSFKLTIPKLF